MEMGEGISFSIYLKAQPTVCAHGLDEDYERKGNEEARGLGNWKHGVQLTKQQPCSSHCRAAAESLAFDLGHTTLMVLFLKINKLKRAVIG